MGTFANPFLDMMQVPALLAIGFGAAETFLTRKKTKSGMHNHPNRPNIAGRKMQVDEDGKRELR